MTRGQRAPILLLTRPEAQSRDFAARLREAGADMACVIAPLTRIAPTGARVPTGAAAGDLVFTSGRAVELAGDLGGRRAWCVGARTAALARARGAEAASAGGNVEALLADLLAQAPRRVIHLRGAETRGDLAEGLSAAGWEVEEVVLYRAEPLGLTAAAMDALTGAAPVWAPVFSPRGAGFLARLAPKPPARIFAISAAAGAAFQDQAEVEVAPSPDADAMIGMILNRLGNLSSGSDVVRVETQEFPGPEPGAGREDGPKR